MIFEDFGVRKLREGVERVWRLTETGFHLLDQVSIFLSPGGHPTQRYPPGIYGNLVSKNPEHFTW